ncbi:MAG: hypothetical protein ACUVV0_13845 [Anaerolineae bacterium]
MSLLYPLIRKLKSPGKEYAEKARAELEKFAPKGDGIWENIWQRQIGAFPEVYWAICAPPWPAEVKRLLGDAALSGHPARYTLASLTLNARKGMRQFGQTEEKGEKDTLRGEREALHTQSLSAKDYWGEVSKGLQSKSNLSLVRPDGRERLDALGVVKRFIPPQTEGKSLAEKFPSTSSVAAADFRRHIANNTDARKALDKHRQKIAEIKDKYGCKVFKSGDGFDSSKIGLVPWDYDGDLLYDSAFTPQTFKDDYGLEVKEKDLEPARQSLRDLYHTAEG